MSAAWAVDASVAIAWMHPGQATPETQGLLTDVEDGAAVIVPPLWFCEVANGLLVAQRRNRLTEEERSVALDKLSKLQFIVDQKSTRAAFGETSKLAEKYGRSVYDAAYLELAVRRKVNLASKDGPLREAAKKSGVRLLGEALPNLPS